MSQSVMLGLDRKAMETERLARLAKKRSEDSSREISPPPPTKVAKLNVPQDAQKSVSNPEIMSQDTPQSSQRAEPTLEFPQGILRKTWAFKHERHNDIKIEEVLDKKNLRTAVISSFNWNFDWLVTKFDMQQTKFVFVIQARNEHEKQMYKNDFQGLSRVRLCFPPLPGGAFTCMHSKLMLLFFTTHLRVVVPSANCMPHDWGETGHMENSVFLIDLPRLPEELQGGPNPTLTSFSKELSRFLKAMTIHEDVQLGILNFDFSKTQGIQFVHTMAGSHLGAASKYTGYPGLSRAIRKLNLETEEELQVDMAISSVGAIDHDFIASLYRALQGSEPKEPTPSGSKSKKTSSKEQQNFRIIFPSRETVQQSLGGPENGGTIFLKPDYYKRPAFPSALIRDYKSVRTGLLSHNKLTYARSPASAFVYMGSANLSHAAWGKLTYDKASKGAKLSTTNWECGVLLRVPAEHLKSNEIANDASEDPKPLPMSVFNNLHSPPFEYPAQEYSEGQLPWSAGT